MSARTHQTLLYQLSSYGAADESVAPSARNDAAHETACWLGCGGRVLPGLFRLEKSWATSFRLRNSSRVLERESLPEDVRGRSMGARVQRNIRAQKCSRINPCNR